MDELMEILEEIRPDVDFEAETELVDGNILRSFDIISIVSEISDTFNVRLTPAEMIPENFNSAEALWNLIRRLQK